MTGGQAKTWGGRYSTPPRRRWSGSKVGGTRSATLLRTACDAAQSRCAFGRVRTGRSSPRSAVRASL
jgi:hypothetical protein